MMFGTTTQKTADEAIRRIETLPQPQRIPNTALNAKGLTGMDVQKLAESVIGRARGEVAQAPRLFPPAWAWSLKRQHRLEVVELLTELERHTRYGTAKAAGTDEEQFEENLLRSRLNKLKEKAQRRADKRNRINHRS